MAAATVKSTTSFVEVLRTTRGRATTQARELGSQVRTQTILWLREQDAHLMLFTGDPLPDVARRSLAVEPLTCAPNAFEAGDRLLTLAPDESFVASWGIQPA